MARVQQVSDNPLSSYFSERTNAEARFFDETTAPDGSVQPYWQKIVDYYQRLGNQNMVRRALDVDRQLKENGVTYNIYGDPRGMNRPWTLDPVPMVFSAEDWQIIEKGLIQRATLLNILLKDIYGHRKLIRSGHIPFELTYNHKGFLHQVDKLQIPSEQQLIQYSADLARGPNGRMWVLDDRTDAPSGLGYSFENRVAMTRVFPDLIRQTHIRKINTYYETLSKTLSNLSWQNKEDPSIVFLSPGVDNETYFEHAYLSSLMGFTLVTGADLTVSDGYVWLKTIKGLKKVDVIIRRVDDVFCDPLEFNMESQLGVVGLMESIRQKKVMVINPLGSRVLENPGLMAFLPQLCRDILGEELILPSVATWWCGGEYEKQYVLDNLQHLIIRSIYRDSAAWSVKGSDLSKEEMESLRNDIINRPYMFVGQEVVNFSTTPVYINGELKARNAVFRSYVLADTVENKYIVMPGGLSRSSATAGIFLISNQTGGISKDTWVLGNASSPKREPMPEPKIITQTEYVLPSSTADNLFWLGRYAERTIFLVRLARVIIRKYNETENQGQVEKDVVLSAFLKALSNITFTLPGFEDVKNLGNPNRELISVLTDAQKPGSLSQALDAFLRNGFAVRDRLGLDIWRILDNISEKSDRLEKVHNLGEIDHILDELLVELMAFNGLSVDTMTRDAAWNLQDIGAYVEKSITTSSLLKHILATRYDAETEKSLLETLLINNQSLITYRYLYQSTIDISSVISLLLLNEQNPRSVAYLLVHLDREAMHLPQSSNVPLDDIRKKILEALTMVRLSDPGALKNADKKSKQRKELTTLLDKVDVLLNKTSSLIINQYFNHTDSNYGFVKTRIPEI